MLPYGALCLIPLRLLLVTATFQHAAEPLFHVKHVDSDSRLDLVFPRSLECPAFLNPLLYSMVQTGNRGKTTVDGLRLRGKALHCLRCSTFTDDGWGHADIGAILVLQVSPIGGATLQVTRPILVV